jgi:hypothetical protein
MFPVFTHVTGGSDKRLAFQTTAAPTGRQVGWSFFDKERNELCYPALFGDEYRCGPSGYSPDVFYTDDRCTQPIARVAKDTCSPVSYVRDTRARGCPSGPPTYYQRAAAYAGPVYTSKTVRYADRVETTCTAVTLPADTLLVNLRAVPETAFPELTYVGHP